MPRKKKPLPIDFQDLTNVPKRFSRLTNRIANDKFAEARGLAISIRDSMETIIVWAEGKEAKPIKAPAAWPFPVESYQTLCMNCYARYPNGTAHFCDMGKK